MQYIEKVSAITVKKGTTMSIDNMVKETGLLSLLDSKLQEIGVEFTCVVDSVTGDYTFDVKKNPIKRNRKSRVNGNEFGRSID